MDLLKMDLFKIIFIKNNMEYYVDPISVQYFKSRVIDIQTVINRDNI